jgi:hypothetical protein
MHWKTLDILAVFYFMVGVRFAPAPFPNSLFSGIGLLTAPVIARKTAALDETPGGDCENILILDDHPATLQEN